MRFLSLKLRRRNGHKDDETICWPTIRRKIKCMFRRVLSLLGVFVCCNAGVAQEVQAQHARVELVSQQTTFAPGQENLLGVHFSLEKDWHIYWINPGDSSQPPVLHWQLPAGFKAGEIQWPHPVKL